MDFQKWRGAERVRWVFTEHTRATNLDTSTRADYCHDAIHSFAHDVAWILLLSANTVQSGDTPLCIMSDYRSVQPQVPPRFLHSIAKVLHVHRPETFADSSRRAESLGKQVRTRIAGVDLAGHSKEQTKNCNTTSTKLEQFRTPDGKTFAVWGIIYLLEIMHLGGRGEKV